MVIQCQGGWDTSFEDQVACMIQRQHAEAGMLVKSSFLGTGYPPPILTSRDAVKQEEARAYLLKLRNALAQLHTDVLVHLFGDQAYIERSNCAQRMNNFIRSTIYRDQVRLIPQDKDLRGESNRIGDRRYQIMAKLNDLIIAIGRELMT